MSKAIEELAKPIAKDFIVEYKGKINNDAPLTHECVQYTIERMLSVPLAQRLTDAEKKRMRNIYKELTECIENSISDVKYLKGKRTQLILIFGKDFFKEDNYDYTKTRMERIYSLFYI